MIRTVYKEIASCVDARLRCIKLDNVEWIGRHAERAADLTKRFLPSGSGFDAGTTLDVEASTGERLVFNTSFHHMNDTGMYDGWTEHQVIVTPSLIHTVSLRITGRDRNDIKSFMYDAFHADLTKTFEE